MQGMTEPFPHIYVCVQGPACHSGTRSTITADTLSLVVASTKSGQTALMRTTALSSPSLTIKYLQTPCAGFPTSVELFVNISQLPPAQRSVSLAGFLLPCD